MVTEFLGWVARKLGLERWASKQIRKCTDFFADHFSPLARRWLIVLLFVAFLFMSGPWRDEWNKFRLKYFSQSGGALETNYVPTTLPVLTTNSGRIPRTQNMSANVMLSNGVPLVLHGTNGATYVMTDKGPLQVLPPSPPNSMSGPLWNILHRLKDRWDKARWYELLWSNILTLIDIAFALIMAILIAIAITTVADSADAELREEIKSRLATPSVNPTLPKTEDKGAAPEDEKIQSLLAESKKLSSLLSESGIQAVYGAVLKRSIVEQEYAPEIQSVVRETTTLKILTVAGFEYIGKGADALIYKCIEGCSHKSIEVILVDPLKGHAVILDRVAKLSGHRDKTYSEPKLKQQISETRETLQKMHQDGKNIKLFYTPMHPVFRLLIADNCLFFSTYSGEHGHEAPLYKVMRCEAGGGESSWYDAFVQLFDNAKSGSEQQNI